jgi:hypothetical protein
LHDHNQTTSIDHLMGSFPPHLSNPARSGSAAASSPSNSTSTSSSPPPHLSRHPPRCYPCQPRDTTTLHIAALISASPRHLRPTSARPYTARHSLMRCVLGTTCQGLLLTRKPRHPCSPSVVEGGKRICIREKIEMRGGRCKIYHKSSGAYQAEIRVAVQN